MRRSDRPLSDPKARQSGPDRRRQATHGPGRRGGPQLAEPGLAERPELDPGTVPGQEGQEAPVPEHRSPRVQRRRPVDRAGLPADQDAIAEPLDTTAGEGAAGRRDGAAQLAQQTPEALASRRIVAAADRGEGLGQGTPRHLGWGGPQRRLREENETRRIDPCMLHEPASGLEVERRAAARLVRRQPLEPETVQRLLAQARPGEASRPVARVLEPGLAETLQRREQPRLGHGEQRPQQTQAGHLPDRRHAGETVRPATAPFPERDGLDLIVLMMRQQEVQDRATPAAICEQVVAGPSGRRLDAGGRFRPAPGQDLVGDAACAEPGTGGRRLGGGFGPQAVIDREAEDLAASGACPAVGEQAERQAVRPAGDTDGEPRRPLERRERGDQARELGVVERIDGASRSRRASVRGRPPARCARGRSGTL